MIDRLSIRRGPTPASCGYVLHPVLCRPPPSPVTHPDRSHFQVYALHIYKGVKHEPHRWHRTLYKDIYAYFPHPLRVLPSAPLLILCPPFSTLPYLHSCLSLSFSFPFPPPLSFSVPLSSLPLFPAKPTGRLANEAPLHRFCVGRAMLDWCRCVCKRAGQRQCFESSVRPHYFTPGLGTAIPSTSSLYNTARHLPPFPLSQFLPRSFARRDPDTQPILIDMGFRLPLTTYVT